MTSRKKHDTVTEIEIFIELDKEVQGLHKYEAKFKEGKTVVQLRHKKLQEAIDSINRIYSIVKEYN